MTTRRKRKQKEHLTPVEYVRHELSFRPTGWPFWSAIATAARPFNASRPRQESQNCVPGMAPASRMKKNRATSTSE